MSKRFERLTGNVEAWAIGAVLLIVAIAYFISQVRG
jgi:hypothetical protein